MGLSSRNATLYVPCYNELDLRLFSLQLVFKNALNLKCYSFSVILYNFTLSPLIFVSCLVTAYASAVTVLLCT